MPLDSSRSWQNGLVVPGPRFFSVCGRALTFGPVQSTNASETARRWAYADGPGRSGIIRRSANRSAAIQSPFASRPWQGADCLFSLHEHDLQIDAAQPLPIKRSPNRLEIWCFKQENPIHWRTELCNRETISIGRIIRKRLRRRAAASGLGACF